MRSRLKQGLTEEQVSTPGVWFLRSVARASQQFRAYSSGRGSIRRLFDG